MRTETSPFAWTRPALLAAVVMALLVSLLPQNVGADTIETREQASGNQNCASTHTIVAGETLSGIAESARVSLSALSQANNITNPDNIYIGLSLCIPPAEVIAAQEAPSTPTASQATGTAAEWTGKYYSGQELSGDPVLTRQDAAIHFDWESGSPDASIANDSFSVSWTASSDFEAGTYRFSARADDGVRIYVDDTLQLEDWNLHPATTTITDIEMTEGSHTIKVEYFEADGLASISVWWEKQAEEELPVCETQPHDRLNQYWSQRALGCPSAAAATVWSAWQPFEKGHMVWRQDENFIYVFADDGNWERFDDEWDDQALTNNRGTPPTDRRSPMHGFGYLWETNDDVYADLGWATHPEKGFCALVQQFEKGILLIGDPVETCFGDEHNFQSDTPFQMNTLQALNAGTWGFVCQIQTHERLRNSWRHNQLGCPLSAGKTLWSSWQPFERGHMIWRQDDDAVFAFDNVGEWTRFSDDWDNQALTGDRGTAPEGMQTPVRGFGYLWETDDDVFSDLGWATDEEKGFCALAQEFAGGTLLIGDPVDFCFDDSENLASESPFAANPLQALTDGPWAFVCQVEAHENLDHLWNYAEFGCPLAAGGVLWSSWQPFQRGHMIWRQDDDAVFVFVNDEAWDRFADDWDDQEYSSDRGTPPEGLQAPMHGFGYLWETDDDVFADLGWATAEERGFCALFQQYENGFLLLSDSVPSCLDGHPNEATELDFALHSLKALDDDTWTLK